MDYSSLHLHKINTDIFSDFNGHIHSLDFSEACTGLLPGSESFFIRLHSFHTVVMNPEAVSSCTLPNCFCIVFCRNGCGTVHCSNRATQLKKGNGVFLSLSEPVRFSADERSWHFTFMILTGELCRQLYQALDTENRLFTSAQFSDFEERQFLLLKRLRYNGRISSFYELSSHLDLLLTRIVICSKKATTDNKMSLIMQVVSYMQKHFCEDINIEALAASCNFSVSQFRKIFSSNMQCSPKQYLIYLRLQHACNLLTQTNLSIEDIGSECGFSNTNHFIQTFKKSMDLTPLQYRKSCSSDAGRPGLRANFSESSSV